MERGFGVSRTGSGGTRRPGTAAPTTRDVAQLGAANTASKGKAGDARTSREGPCTLGLFWAVAAPVVFGEGYCVEG